MVKVVGWGGYLFLIQCVKSLGSVADALLRNKESKKIRLGKRYYLRGGEDADTSERRPPSESGKVGTNIPGDSGKIRNQLSPSDLRTNRARNDDGKRAATFI